MPFLTNRFRFDWILDDKCKYMEVVEEIKYKDIETGITLTIPIGFRTDGKSAPKITWSFLGGPFTGPDKFAAVVHDYALYSKLMSNKDADRVFKDILKEFKVNKVKISLMYKAVRFWSVFTKFKKD